VSGLRGRRVVVTRVPDQAGPLVDRLRAAGAVVIEVPTVAVEPPVDQGPLDAALAGLDSYDWLVLTSASGAAALGPRRDGATPRLAAVGPATAAAMTGLGWPSAWTPSTANGRTLARELPVRPGERVLLLRSDLADRMLPSALAARGAIVDDVIAYRTVPRRDPAPELAQAFDAVVLMSPSAVDGLLNALGDAARLAGKVLIAAGPTTAAHLAKRGLRPTEAAQPTADAILAALASAATPAGVTA
jgi:uroporphyrinogen-III synthase